MWSGFAAFRSVIRAARPTIHAAATGLYGADPGEPAPLTAFRYVEMYYYDTNGNLVMDAVEDRGNTSGVQGSPPGAIVPPRENTATRAGEGSEAVIAR